MKTRRHFFNELLGLFSFLPAISPARRADRKNPETKFPRNPHRESPSRLPLPAPQSTSPSRYDDHHADRLSPRVTVLPSVQPRAARPEILPPARPSTADSPPSPQSGRFPSPAIPAHRGSRFPLPCTAPAPPASAT